MILGMKKIDFHVHYLTPSYKAFVIRNFGGELPEWSVESQLAVNADNDIAYSLLGISTPYFNAGDMDETRRTVIANNNEIAAMTKGKESELGYLAALPVPDVAQSLFEIDRVLQMGAKGFTFDTNMGGVYLGDSLLDPVMEKLNGLHAIAVVHPTKPSAVPSGVLDGFRIQALEFFFDTTRTFVNLSRNLAFQQFPDIRWIFPHAGALIPAISDRVPSSFRKEGKGADLFADLKHVYFDLAGPAEPKLINLLKMVAPADHFLYGSDYPYATAPEVEKYRLVLEQTDKLTPEEKELAFYRNGAALLGMGT
jgi:6-methylsalicylate decarboxylase